MRGIGECLHTACQHLVGICLVGDVEHYLVFRSVEYIVECDDGLHHTEVGTYVAAMYGELLYKVCAEFGCELLEFRETHPADVCRRFYF